MKLPSSAQHGFSKPDEAIETVLVRAGRSQHNGEPHPVSPPVVRMSTVLFDSMQSLRDTRVRRDRDKERVLIYGARGNPTAFALEDLVTELEGGFRTKLYPSGLAAIGQMFLAYLRPGDHVLVTDGVYSPVRRVAQQYLMAFGIEVEYCRGDGQGLDQQLRPNTRMVYVESPSSVVYEMVDIPAVSALCKARGVLLAVDNTWGSGYLCRPLALGADISVMALTKYVAGHSDVMMGAVCTTEAAFDPLAMASDAFGNTVSADDAWLVMRGARTLAARMAIHQQQALVVAQWLKGRAEVAKVIHPALADHPGHAIWRRDCLGSNGLLTIELVKGSVCPDRFVDALQVFGLGASWGGYESLVAQVDLTARQYPPTYTGALIRLHVGLEDKDTLLTDLATAFEAARL